MRFKERLTYANVMSTLCMLLLVVGVGGGAAYAHGLIGPGDIKDNAVRSKHIKNGQVKSKDIKNNNVKSKDIKNNNVKSKDIKDGSLTGADIKNGSLAGNDLQPKAEGLIQAAVHSAGNGDVRQQFNRLGGAVTVVRTNTGRYTVTIPGATGDWTEKIAGVSTTNLFKECKTWTGSGPDLNVVCTQSSNGDWSYQDTAFSLWLMR